VSEARIRCSRISEQVREERSRHGEHRTSRRAMCSGVIALDKLGLEKVSIKTKRW
jgi:hypothetical protein